MTHPDTRTEAAVAWLNQGLVLDLIHITRRRVFDDLTAVLVLAAVADASYCPSGPRPKLEARSARRMVARADHRRPIATSRIALSIRLPRETARGKALGLLGRGWLERRPDGFVAHPALGAIDGPLLAPFTERLCRYLDDLERLGVVGQTSIAGLSIRDVHAATEVLRVLARHSLRQWERWRTTAPFEPHLQTYILADLSQATGAHFTAAGCEPPPWTRVTPRSHGLKIAARLSLPPETVRRNLNALCTAGRIERGYGGFSVAAIASGADVGTADCPAIASAKRLVVQLNALGPDAPLAMAG
ncbi:DeoR family transcriptional regulator [Brevundimonas sp. VNH65]|uniref:DeoR family transcriptional regulator n=1 Tax=Brevundimonas sp. VNH65 TaxID=3400917 RepID=UPI003C098AB7